MDDPHPEEQRRRASLRRHRQATAGALEQRRMTTDDFYDALETRSPAQREAALMAALPAQVAHAKAHTGAFAELFADVDPITVSSREALARLPVVRKHELLARQRAQRTHTGSGDVFGGFAAIGW